MKCAIAIFCAIAVIDAAAAYASTNGQHAAEATNHLTKLKTKESMYKAASSEALQEIRLAETSLQDGGVTTHNVIQTSAAAHDSTAGDEATNSGLLQSGVVNRTTTGTILEAHLRPGIHILLPFQVT